MSFKELDIKKCYETTADKCSLIDNFYNPILAQTVNYYRIAGFFSSSSLIVAAKGISRLIKNNGKMQLLISPELSDADFNIIKKCNGINENLELFKDFNIDDFTKNDNLQALGWLLSTGKLQIKIVIGKNSKNSLFHQKVGICVDKDRNVVSFSGSINETAKAWLNNIEEFKTFCSWNAEQLEYLTSDFNKFKSYWNDERKDVAEVYDVPNSIKEKIIRIVPKDYEDLYICKKYKSDHNSNEISLFKHQRDAVNAWLNNDCRLLFEMATGTGKTRTAIACILKLKDKVKPLLTIISTPQVVLTKQWYESVNELNVEFDKSIFCDGTNGNWNNELKTLIEQLNNGYYSNAVVYTNHTIISECKFINIIKNTRKAKILFICDEVHGIGSEHQRNALLNIYDYRIGLSATPDRMYDDEGTTILYEYFGNNKFEFSIKDALSTINEFTGLPFLNEYYYKPVFITLNLSEYENYKEYSTKIFKLQRVLENEYSEENEKILNNLLIKRADILKNASDKINKFKELLDNLNKGNLKDTIVFTSPEQIEMVCNELNIRAITSCKITEEESTTKKLGNNGNSVRKEYIERFKNGNLQVLVGIKCLDEGIDLVNARIAILLSNSKNPREYVQRIGRVIRAKKGKEKSIIYDFIVDCSQYGDTSILSKEKQRAEFISKTALNYNEVIQIFEEKGV